MTYTKPKDVTYTQMAMWIDDVAYSDNCNDELLFEYLYHLSVMLAYKSRYFSTSKHYDEFGLYLASSAYFRLKSNKQYVLDEYGVPKLKKIKSILNYLKTILYPRKVAFEQENYAQTNIVISGEDCETYPGYTFANRLSDTADLLSRVDFECTLQSIDKSIRNYMKRIPYKYESSDWYAIYMSVMLSFLNSIIMNASDKERMRSAKYKMNDHNRLLEMYEKQSDNYIILYHLGKEMRPYIWILVRLLKKSVAQDLSITSHTEINTNRLSFPILQRELNSIYEE